MEHAPAHGSALEWSGTNSSLVDEVFALFLDENSGSSPDASLDSALGLASQPKQIKKRRRRPKDDLELLRKTAKELEAKLAALRISSVENDTDGEESGWREVALHQRRQVERARSVNAQLHAVLKEQTQLANELQQILIRHMRLARVEGALLPQTLRPAPPPTHFDVRASPALFQGLVNELDGMYSRLDAVFKDASFDEFDSKKASMRECTLRTSASGTFFEIRHMERFPFPPEALHRAIGKALAVNSSKYAYSTSREVNENTIQYAFSHLLPSVGIIMNSKMVIRRLVERDRVVLIWLGDVDLEGGMSVRLREEGWGIAKPLSSSASSSSLNSPPLVLRNVLHLKPEFPDTQTLDEQRRYAGEMMDMVLDAYRWLVTLVNETIENAMLTDVRGTIEAESQPDAALGARSSIESASDTDDAGVSNSRIYQV